MKKKIMLLNAIFLIIVIIFAFVNLLMPVPTYLYINKVYTNHHIIIHVRDRSDHYKYQKYEFD